MPTPMAGRLLATFAAWARPRGPPGSGASSNFTVSALYLVVSIHWLSFWLVHSYKVVAGLVYEGVGIWLFV